MWNSAQPSQQQKTELRVYAGTSYDKSKLVPVPVNLKNEDNDSLVQLESDLVKAKVAVRIQDYQVPKKPEDLADNSTTSSENDSKNQISVEGIKNLL